MKREIDKNGRVIYKFSHSVHQGGFVYSHKTKVASIITNKDGVRNALNAIAKQFELILQDRFVREELRKWGFDYEQG